MSPSLELRLAPGDQRDVDAVVHDRFQSPRARKRCCALIQLSQGDDPEETYRTTGVTPLQQIQMLERFCKHGLHAAIFGLPRRDEQRRYDVKKIAAVISKCINSRPPPGSLRWNLCQLTAEVHHELGEDSGVSKETVRQIMKSELGIRSIRQLDPFWMKQVHRQ